MFWRSLLSRLPNYTSKQKLLTSAQIQAYNMGCKYARGYCISNIRSTVPGPISSQCLKNSPFCIFSGIQSRKYGMKIPEKGKKRGKTTKVKVSDEEMSNVIDVEFFRVELRTVVDHLKEDYVRHVSLRSSSGSIETLPVTVDGQEYPLNELGQVTRKNPQLIVINLVGFPQALQPALDALQNSGMNLSPQQEGTTLYVPVPKVTKEHRELMVKNAKSLLNKCKESIRAVQNKYLKESTKYKEDLSSDLVFNVGQQIMAISSEHVAQAEKLFAAKENELLGKSN